MAFQITNPETLALAQRYAAREKIGLAEAVHLALCRELERELARQALVERTRAFTKELRAQSDPAKGLPADKDFIDSLYED